MRNELTSARRLCFDTSAVIYLLNRVEPYFQVVEGLFRPVRDGVREAVLSVVTEIDLLVKPLREGRRAEIGRIDVLLDADGVNVMDLDRLHVARVAAELRAGRRLSLADAVIVATGIVTDCDAVVGNDERCARRVTEIPYFYLEDHLTS